MGFELWFTFGVLGCSMALFVSDRVRLDLVAVGAMLALTLGGILPAKAAIAGFADPVLITIAALFVVGEGLSVTGIADRFGLAIVRIAGHGEVRLLLACMVAAGVLSAFMSSTGAVAMLMPVLLGIAAREGVAPGKLMMPLAFAALLGGMLTLIGTAPNLVANGALAQASVAREAAGLPGYAPFHFFSFTPLGGTLLVLGIGFMVTVGRRLLPSRAGGGLHTEAAQVQGVSTADLAGSYGLPGSTFRLRVPRHATLSGRTIADCGLRKRYQVTVLQVRAMADVCADGSADQASAKVEAGQDPADAAREQGVTPTTVIVGGGVLIVQGTAANVAELARGEGLDILPADCATENLLGGALGMAEVVLTPRSRLIGQTLAATSFRDAYHVNVLGLLRLGKPFEGDLANEPLRFGDTLLVQGTWKDIQLLKRQRTNLVVVGEPLELVERERARTARRGPVAALVVLAMLIVMSFDLLPAVTASLLAAMAMVVFGCLTMDRAYTSINWQGIVLIAGMLPLATALDKTGGLQLIVDALISTLGGAGSHAVLAGLFVVTSSLSLVMSNTATAVILAPVAVQAAGHLGDRPEAYLMVVALAASTAFATPVASPVNTLVLGAGGYRFGDFVKVGVPMQLLCMAVTIALVGVFFPLR